MILFGCLLAFSAAVAPRLVLILAWIFSDRWAKVWEGDFLLPVLGIIFLPYTTIMFMLTVTVLPSGGTVPLQGWDWLWIALGLFLDFMKWSQMLTNRKEAQKQASAYYPSGAPKESAGSAAAKSTAAVASGSVQSSTSVTAPDAATTGADTMAESPAAAEAAAAEASTDGDDKDSTAGDGKDSS
jgi:hypothetical protein